MDNSRIRKSLILIIIFLTAFIPTQALNVQCKTLPIVQTSNPLITFDMNMASPTMNATFTNVMLLDFEVETITNLSLPEVSLGLSVFYRIDNNSEVHLSSDQSYYEFIDITNLTNGIHKLTILAQRNYIYNDSIVQNKQELPKQIYFSIFNRPADINILSPQNSIYFTTNIPLTVEIDNPSSYGYQQLPLYRQYYRLDGGKMQWQNDNDTIVGLKDGFHSITYYVQIGYLSSSSIESFIVIGTPLTQILLMTAIVSILVSVFILLSVYRRHRKTIKLS